MKRRLVGALLVAIFAVAAAAPAAFADKPKFNPNESACQGPNDQPNCPGGPH